MNASKPIHLGLGLTRGDMLISHKFSVQHMWFKLWTFCLGLRLFAARVLTSRELTLSR